MGNCSGGNGGISPSSTTSPLAGMGRPVTAPRTTGMGPPCIQPANSYSLTAGGSGIWDDSITAGSCPRVMATGSDSPRAWARSMASRPCLPLFILTETLFFSWIITR